MLSLIIPYKFFVVPTLEIAWLVCRRFEVRGSTLSLKMCCSHVQKCCFVRVKWLSGEGYYYLLPCDFFSMFGNLSLHLILVTMINYCKLMFWMDCLMSRMESAADEILIFIQKNLWEVVVDVPIAFSFVVSSLVLQMLGLDKRFRW